MLPRDYADAPPPLTPVDIDADHIARHDATGKDSRPVAAWRTLRAAALVAKIKRSDGAPADGNLG